MAYWNSEILKNIRRIHIHTNHIVEGILAGAYHSAFKGQGIEFEEAREYQEGDEVRLIDWNVTARMNRPYVKKYKEERDLTILLAIDISASQLFGSGFEQKREFIAEIGAVLALSAIKNDDKVGLVLFSNNVEKYIPPNKGVKHVLRVIRELLLFEPKEKGTDVSSALSFLGKVQKRFAVCFLISDFLSPDYARALSVAARRYDLIAMAIVDPKEIVLPTLGVVHFSDLETGESIWVDSSSSKIKEHFASKAKAHMMNLEKQIKKVGAGFIPIYTDRPYIEALRKYFVSKSRLR